MVSEVQSSTPDQHHGYSLLSMLPRTFKKSTNDALKSNVSDDLDYIHQYLKSMSIKSPHKLFEQAKSILEGGSEFLKMNLPSIAAPESKTEAIAVKGKQNPQVRRPGLGRKRARFSLKPETSQPITSMEPSFDGDQLQNPEDYFDAYEKFENARKELQRQKGDDMSGLEEVKSPMNERRRRPGISGKKVMYKHHQYSACTGDDVFSSQEASQHGIPNPSYNVSQDEMASALADSQEKDLVGSISKAENRFNEIFDELLSSQIDSLDGEKAVSFLRDRLQIKPFDLENLCLPDFHDVSRTVVPLEEKVPKKRNALSDISNLLDELRSGTAVRDKQLSSSPIQPVASPTPPKNPFAPVSLSGKHISQSMPSIDPFSIHNINLFPAANLSAEILNDNSDQVNTRLELSISGKLESLSNEKITTNTVANDPHEVPGGDLTSEMVDDSPSELEVKDDDQCNVADDWAKDDNICVETNGQTWQHHAVEENAEDVLQEASPSVQPQLDVNMVESTEMDVQPYGLHDIDGNAKDIQQQASSSELPGSNVELAEMEHMDENQSLLGQKNPSANEDHDNAPERGPDQQIEEHEIVSRKERTRTTRQGPQRNALSRRQSLAEAGTMWISGVRRSSRVKHRPLEYWKGERLLYGRVHCSLPTVIGLKYISPTKGEENRTFRVKSYVSEEYNELVELAALH